MGSLTRRLEALESKGGSGEINWALRLDRLTMAELERLEVIVAKVEAGVSIQSLPDDDLRLIASIQVGRADHA